MYIYIYIYIYKVEFDNTSIYIFHFLKEYLPYYFVRVLIWFTLMHI